VLSDFLWVDWAILGILSVSAIISLIRGFVKEALSLAFWAVAFVVSMTFHSQMMQLLEGAIERVYLRELVAYISLFAGTLLVGAMTTYLLSEFVKKTGLGGTDRLLGMIFGAARGVIVVVALLVIAPKLLTDIDQDAWWQESRLIPHFMLLKDWSEQSFSEVSAWISSLVAEHRA
jgi:membrane protein required for colicin V production|tara:strand:+ start:177 stop:701 length:525 start_codon:yes stop_codon:yes gene_type:complete